VNCCTPAAPYTIATAMQCSADTFEKVYGWSREASIVPFSQPGLVTIPLGFLVLVVVSLLTPPQPAAAVRRHA
jgi:Na+(H+)/acetate symporter ActP